MSAAIIVSFIIGQACWPSWGGPAGDFTVSSSKLCESWPAKGPPTCWRRELGEGYSAFVSDGRKLYTTISRGENEMILALDPMNGRTLWEASWKRDEFFEDLTREFGDGPQSTPLVTNVAVFAIGLCGQMRAFHSADGRPLWSCDLHRKYGRLKRKEEYGYAGQPLQYASSVIVPVGGAEASVVALELSSGKEIWRSAPGRVSYAPPVLVRLLDQDHYIYFSPEEAIALDPATGKRRWVIPCTCSTGNNLTPAVKCDDQHVWIAGQFEAGARLVRLTRNGDVIQPETVWREEKLSQAHWNNHVIGDTLYGGVGGNYQSFFSAVNWRTGKTLWRERTPAVPKPVLADGKMIWIDQDGWLHLARVSPLRLERLAKTRVLSNPAWTPPTLIGTKLFLRDRREAACIEIGTPRREGKS